MTRILSTASVAAFLAASIFGSSAALAAGSYYKGSSPTWEQDQEIDVNDKNKVLIRDRKVRMEDADCPDQICVNHRAISRDGESIICLPNQTVVTIRGGEEPEVDEIAR